MEKKNMNIVLSVLLVILIICSTFTGLAIKNISGPRFDFKVNAFNNMTANNQIEQNDTSIEENITNETTNDQKNPNPKGSYNRPNRPGNGQNGRPSNRPNNGQNRKADIFDNNMMVNRNIDLYLTLFAIENLLSGAIILYLVLSNIKVNKKELIKL